MLVTVLGIVPGFVMVLVSFILLMIEINTRDYLSMLSAGLLLEVGSVQLYHILKKNNIKR